MQKDLRAFLGVVFLITHILSVCRNRPRVARSEQGCEGLESVARGHAVRPSRPCSGRATPAIRSPTEGHQLRGPKNDEKFVTFRRTLRSE